MIRFSTKTVFPKIDHNPALNSLLQFKLISSLSRAPSPFCQLLGLEIIEYINEVEFIAHYLSEMSSTAEMIESGHQLPRAPPLQDRVAFRVLAVEVALNFRANRGHS